MYYYYIRPTGILECLLTNAGITNSMGVRVLLEKPPVAQPLKFFPTVYRVHKSPPLVPILSQSIQSIPLHPLSLKSILILLSTYV
jgi:hypothetical protein